jgi:hypothetical protein
VPSCPECRRLLAIRFGAHPGRLDAVDGGRAAPFPGMERLAAQIAPDRRWSGRVVAGVGVVAALAAAAGIAAVLGSAPADPPPAPAPVASAPLQDPRPAAPESPDVREEPRPSSVTRVAPAPSAAPRAPDAPPDLPVGDAVADADDWPMPPYEDLRVGVPKGAPSPVRAAELIVAGSHNVGGAVGLTVVSSTDTEVAVCVDGPERGVVWRGAVPAGRTELSRGGRDQRFAFAAPGSYRFVLSTSGQRPSARACTDPVHVVVVEVR